MKEPYDIKARTFEFALRIVGLCRSLGDLPGVSRDFAHQLFRAGTSLGANVEEAHTSHGRQDFIAGMSTAVKWARETSYWLRLLEASEVECPADLGEIVDEAGQLVAILTTIVKRSRENPS